MSLSDEWLTYREAAARLGSNIEAIRQRAIRCRWPRVLGNDKRARVQIPEGVTSPLREGNDRPPRTADERAYDGPLEGPLIKALEAHVATLKEQLAGAEARIAEQAADLAAEKAQTTKAIAAFASLAERLDALAAERARPWWRRLAG
jgi:hypothetical protein